MSTIRLEPDEFRLLASYIEGLCAIRTTEDKSYLIETRLRPILSRHGIASFHDLYFRAKNQPSSGIKDEIIDAMTTNETLWFRDRHPFTIFEEKLVGQYEEEIAAGKRNHVSVWSAACSMGQEPYSLAMVILEAARRSTTLTPEMFSILATDISESALAVAKSGLYDPIAISRGLPPDFRARYFTSAGRSWSIDDEVKKRVRFMAGNLQNAVPSPGRFDVILCRNVMIYFSDEFKTGLFQRFARALRPKGYLIIGASESLSGYSTEFEMFEHRGGVYYQVR